MDGWMDITQLPYLQIFKFLKLQLKPCEAALHSFQTPLVKLLHLTIFTAIRVCQDTTLRCLSLPNGMKSNIQTKKKSQFLSYCQAQGTASLG